MMPPISRDASHHQDEPLEPRMFDFNGKDMPRNCGHVTGTDVRSRLSTNFSWICLPGFAIFEVRSALA